MYNAKRFQKLMFIVTLYFFLSINSTEPKLSVSQFQIVCYLLLLQTFHIDIFHLLLQNYWFNFNETWLKNVFINVIINVIFDCLESIYFLFFLWEEGELREIRYIKYICADLKHLFLRAGAFWWLCNIFCILWIPFLLCKYLLYNLAV